MNYSDKRDLSLPQALSYFIPQRESAFAIEETSAYERSSAEEALINLGKF